MAMTFDEAVAFVTGPGGPLEIIEAPVRGRTQKVFAATPPSLRALWDSLRPRGDAPFLVFEDEQWSFARVMRERRRARRGARRALRGGQGRPRRHRHAELPRVGRRLRRHHLHRRRGRVAQRVVDRARARVRADRFGGEGGHRRRRPPRTDRRSTRRARSGGDRREVVGDPATGSGPPLRRRHRRSVAARRGHRSRRRRHDPLHLRHHRPPEGRRVDPPRRAHRTARLRLSHHRRVPAPRAEGTAPVSDGVHPGGAALPRDGLHPRDAGCRAHRLEAGDDAQVGPGTGPGADRAGTGHDVRRVSPRCRPTCWPARTSPPATPRRCRT